MAPDYSERRTYRKSPGRQYGYEYNPLHSSDYADRGRHITSVEEAPSRVVQEPTTTRNLKRVGGGLAVRPDPRRTRQLLRQHILEDKSEKSSSPQPLPSHLSEDLRNEDIIDGLMFTKVPYRSRNQPSARLANHPVYRTDPPEYSTYHKGEEDKYADAGEQDQPSVQRRKRKSGISRRKVLWGIGTVAVGGTAIVAANELPRLPQQLGSAFYNGFDAGANAVRKEFITALDSLEGVSLDSAISAAKLTRIAYDAFVSPLVTLAATVTGDFLSVTLQALKTGRSWLSRIGQDSSTLGALQTMLQTWVKQVEEMPKQIQTITDTDLDGAQAYLRALQRKIKAEQDTLNGKK